MIVAGIIAILIAWLTGIGVLYTIGLILIVIGVVLLIAGSVGHPVGGRRHYY
jgi:hypothetical protein